MSLSQIKQDLLHITRTYRDFDKYHQVQPLLECTILGKQWLCLGICTELTCPTLGPRQHSLAAVVACNIGAVREGVKRIVV